MAGRVLADVLDFLSSARRADVLAMAGDNPALAQRLAAAVDNIDADGGKELRTLVFDLQSKRAPAAATPAAAEPTGSRSPLSFEARLMSDPNVRRAMEESGGTMPKDPAEVLPAVQKAYRGAAPKRGRPKRKTTEDSIRELAEPADQQAAKEIAGQFDRALIPYGTRGPGVPVDGPGGPGVTVNPGTELIPSPPRRIGGQTRALSRQEPRGMNPFREEDVRPARIVDEAPPKKRFNKKLAAAAAAGGTVAVDLMMRGRNQDEPAVTSGGEADLAAESRPVPEVEPTDYMVEAARLRTRLNDMRKAAGGEVPEAQAMLAEINRLSALGDKQRNQRNPVYQHAPSNPARTPFNEANQLLAQVNDYARQGVPMSHPWMQHTMARVRQLQAEGDAIINRGVR